MTGIFAMSSARPKIQVIAGLALLTLMAGPNTASAATGEGTDSPSPSEQSPRAYREPSPLDARASDFMNSYWEKVSGDSGEVLAYLGSIYAPIVSYYGKPTPRENILKEKYNFIRRWPLRRTWPSSSAEGPRISCNDATAECEIRGVRDFEAVSAERRARSLGVVYYSYKVRFLDGSAQITAENSEAVRYTGLP
jgi:hypothetical protein